ncbi:hypothetical protein MASR2M78_01120 [Treponema sp.]
MTLRYDRASGYLGTAIAGGDVIAEVSSFDRVLVLKKSGIYSVIDLSEKTFVDKDAWWVGVADKDALSKMVFTVICKDSATGYPLIKRFIVEGWIMNKDYSLVPGSELHIDVRVKLNHDSLQAQAAPQGCQGKF